MSGRGSNGAVEQRGKGATESTEHRTPNTEHSTFNVQAAGQVPGLYTNFANSHEYKAEVATRWSGGAKGRRSDWGRAKTGKIET